MLFSSIILDEMSRMIEREQHELFYELYNSFKAVLSTESIQFHKWLDDFTENVFTETTIFPEYSTWSVW